MASITCGKCKQTHQTVLAVKLCYQNGGSEIRCTWCTWPGEPDVVHTPDEAAQELVLFQEQQAAEIEAERRVERWYEEHF